MSWINLGDPAPSGFFTVGDDDPYYVSPEQEAAMERANECQACDGYGRIEVYSCKGVCDCGMCPEIEDCPECCGHEPPETV